MKSVWNLLQHQVVAKEAVSLLVVTVQRTAVLQLLADKIQAFDKIQMVSTQSCDSEAFGMTQMVSVQSIDFVAFDTTQMVSIQSIDSEAFDMTQMVLIQPNGSEALDMIQMAWMSIVQQLVE